MPQHTDTTPELDQLCINTIRTLSLDAVQKAESGHPGLPLGAAPLAYVLWTRFLRHNPKNPHWENRDRFLLSAGHGSMLIYSLLHLTGYDLPLEELKNFRQWGSKTPGHPEYPSAHAFQTASYSEAFRQLLGTKHLSVTLTSNITGTTRTYDNTDDLLKDVADARVFAGFHFRTSCVRGGIIGKKVAKYVAKNYFLPLEK
mgnify:CR=1 FL=1